MPDANPNQEWIDARVNLKDTAKWIVTILGATVVLVVGGGLIAKIADLSWGPRLFAAGSLLALTVACLIPLRAAIGIIAAKLVSFQEIATSPDYAQTRAMVNSWLAQRDRGEIATIEGLYQDYEAQTEIVNDPQSTADEQKDANDTLDQLQLRMTEAHEVFNTQFLQLKFNWMVRVTTCVLPAIGIALFVFLISTHSDDRTEKQLAHPMFMQIAWSADVEAALKKAGLDEKCFAPNRPQLLQVSEKSGLRAGVLVIPKDLGPACPVVRVIVTNANQVYPDN
jgi:hypothetical protein